MHTGGSPIDPPAPTTPNRQRWPLINDIRPRYTDLSGLPARPSPPRLQPAPPFYSNASALRQINQNIQRPIPTRPRPSLDSPRRTRSRYAPVPLRPDLRRRWSIDQLPRSPLYTDLRRIVERAQEDEEGEYVSDHENGGYRWQAWSRSPNFLTSLDENHDWATTTIYSPEREPRPRFNENESWPELGRPRSRTVVRHSLNVARARGLYYDSRERLQYFQVTGGPEIDEGPGAPRNTPFLRSLETHGRDFSNLRGAATSVIRQEHRELVERMQRLVISRHGDIGPGIPVDGLHIVPDLADVQSIGDCVIPYSEPTDQAEIIWFRCGSGEKECDEAIGGLVGTTRKLYSAMLRRKMILACSVCQWELHDRVPEVKVFYNGGEFSGQENDSGHLRWMLEARRVQLDREARAGLEPFPDF